MKKRTKAGKSNPKKRGRPTKYTQLLADDFCHRISDGASERKACESDDMPDRKTIQRWTESNEDFCRQYARAREERGWTLAEEAIEIADRPVVGVIETDKMTAKGDEYTEVRRADMIEHRRLQVETRKWFASKLNPRRLSEKVQAEHSGPNGGDIPFRVNERAVTVKVDFSDIRKETGRVA